MRHGYKFMNNDATIKVNVYDLLDQNPDTLLITGDELNSRHPKLNPDTMCNADFTYKLCDFAGSQHGEGRRRRFR